MPSCPPHHKRLAGGALLLGGLACALAAAGAPAGEFSDGNFSARITAADTNGSRIYTLASDAPLRGHRPADGKTIFAEPPGHARVRSGNAMFDGLFALAAAEAAQNSVPQIRDWAYAQNGPLDLDAFQTGELWAYVWTRDLAYAAHLALANFDPPRAANSLRFKTSAPKPAAGGGAGRQIIQDTGSGGSWPVSADRIVWALGADAVLKNLPAAAHTNFLREIFPVLSNTIAADRKIIFDPADGLYRGEQSFLDWREQTYPQWAKDNVTAIAQSKALSVNAAYYFALRAAAGYAGQLGLAADAARYAAWAAGLKDAINNNFYDPEAGLYSTYLLSDGGQPVRAKRYDLLGNSLAVLLGIAGAAQAESVIARYPVGPFGPPVVWPEEKNVPVYHNHALWPFVTAYWLKAARAAGNAGAVDAGVRSLMRGAALNLSNMENLDFATGLAEVAGRTVNGPVINSRRQLWSVAGYLAMVQDVVFGLETSPDGIRFRPFVTGRMRAEIFPGTNLVALKNFQYQGKAINVRLHLPPAGETNPGVCQIGKIRLNGKNIGGGFVAAESLAAANEWEIFLSPATAADSGLNRLTAGNVEAKCFAPAPPEWAGGGLAAEGGRPVLRFREAPATNCVFNIYRDGKICAERVAADRWTDPQAADFTNTAHFYTAEALDEKTGNTSHLSPARWLPTPENSRTVPAGQMQNRGGRLAEGKYFADWGRPGDELVVANFSAGQSGRYLVRAEFSNGTGPVNTGITCAVKRLEIRQAGTGTLAAAGYLVMPQSGDWQRFDLSTAVPAALAAGEKYTVKIFEDGSARNMSYLDQNRRYTAGSGGGDAPCNFANIAALHFVRVAP